MSENFISALAGSTRMMRTSVLRHPLMPSVRTRRHFLTFDSSSARKGRKPRGTVKLKIGMNFFCRNNIFGPYVTAIFIIFLSFYRFKLRLLLNISRTIKQTQYIINFTKIIPFLIVVVKVFPAASYPSLLGYLHFISLPFTLTLAQSTVPSKAIRDKCFCKVKINESHSGFEI